MKDIKYIVLYSILLTTFNGFFCKLLAQQEMKKNVSKEDYHLWGKVHISALSPSGDWVAYRTVYEKGDTLFVKNIPTGNKVVLPGGSGGAFFGDSHFIYTLPNHKYSVHELAKGSAIENIDRYQISADGKYLITQAGTSLQVRDHKLRLVGSADDIDFWSVNPCRNIIAYSTGTAGGQILRLLDIERNKERLVSRGAFKSILWDKAGRYLAFLQTNVNWDTFWPALFALQENRLAGYRVSGDLNISFPEGMDAIERISEDGKSIYCSRMLPIPAVESTPEVWRSQATLYFPKSQLLSSENTILQHYRWDVDSNALHYLDGTDNAVLDFFATGNFYVFQAPDTEVASFQTYPRVVYSVGSSENTKWIVMAKFSSDPASYDISAVNDHLVYFKGGSWFLYDPATNRQFEIPPQPGSSWCTDDQARPPVRPYGVAGWSSDGKSVLIYDRWDIWKVDIESQKAEKITDVKSQDKSARLVPNTYTDKIISLQSGFAIEMFCFANGAREYFISTHKRKLLPVATGICINDQLSFNKNNKYVYRTQTFERPPDISFTDLNTGETKIVYKSNKHQKDYFWGKATQLHYKNQRGNEMKAALLYPAGYRPGTSYPMVVKVYESLSSEYLQYQVPTMYNEDGFNPSNYTLNGYVVLLPDIRYDIGNPGKSAAISVAAAVDAAVATGAVDKDKIGLIGHSFGGYEVNYIIGADTHFAAAVSGAGVSETVGWYFSTGEDMAESQAWRFEDQQFRMGKTFFEDREGYIENSPLFQSENIQTPLLLWCGKEDPTVNWQQSVLMFNALRRLGRQSILLAYQDEYHVIGKKANQSDLTTRIEEWFGHYLKGTQCPLWVEK